MQALARNVNIVAFQASTAERRSQIHLVVDNPEAAKMLLAAEGLIYTEGEVVQIALRSLPGELARVTSRLAAVNININYAYGGSDLLFFGVTESDAQRKSWIKPPLPLPARFESKFERQ